LSLESGNVTVRPQLGNVQLLISDCSTGTVTYRLDQLTQGLREAFESLVLGAMPLIV
jgi:hypothetical protein